MRGTVTNPLIDIFFKIPSERVYIQNAFESLTYGDIKCSITQFSENYAYLAGKNCAVVSHSRFELAKFLPLIASVANKVFLQPKCLKEEAQNEFYGKSDIEYVINVTNSGVYSSKVSDPNYLQELEQQWLLSTSGTTGTPKLVSYNITSLMKKCYRVLQ